MKHYNFYNKTECLNMMTAYRLSMLPSESDGDYCYVTIEGSNRTNNFLQIIFALLVKNWA